VLEQRDHNSSGFLVDLLVAPVSIQLAQNRGDSVVVPQPNGVKRCEAWLFAESTVSSLEAITAQSSRTANISSRRIWRSQGFATLGSPVVKLPLAERPHGVGGLDVAPIDSRGVEKRSGLIDLFAVAQVAINSSRGGASYKLDAADPQRGQEPVVGAHFNRETARMLHKGIRPKIRKGWSLTVSSGGSRACPPRWQHLGTDPLKLLDLTVETRSWSISCPHCMNIKLTFDNSKFLSRWTRTLTSLAEGSFLLKTDRRTSCTPVTNRGYSGSAGVGDSPSANAGGKNLCMGRSDDPRQGLLKLLQVPSAVR
jgi:hypothetical protein